MKAILARRRLGAWGAPAILAGSLSWAGAFGAAWAAQSPPAPAAPPTTAPRTTIELADAWTRATPGESRNAAIYLRIRNIAADADTLVGAQSAMAERAELHESMTHGGTTQMMATANVAIPAEQTVTFAPAGRHIMLTNLKAPLAEGESFFITLTFEKAGRRDTVVQVLSATATGLPNGPAVRRNDPTSGATQGP